MTNTSEPGASAVTNPSTGTGCRGGQTDPFVRRHLRFGWWSLLVFLTLGSVLEVLHGFKIGWYLDVTFEARRLMWTLAHAHGTLIGLMHLAFASTLHLQPTVGQRSLGLISSSLIAATILLPGGFFLGGIYIYAGDPGMGVFLAPVGGLLLLLAVFLIARNVSGRIADTPPSPGSHKKSSRRGQSRN